jgi:pyruvate dehydrogenase E1 component beta subunit
MALLNMVDALNLALKQEMQRDKSVIVLGEDVGVDGGVFRVTDGLLKQFGEKRVIDTPLAESGIVGSSIGLAIAGFKPVAEIQFEGFSLLALNQIINHAARMRNRSRGHFTCPLVIRFPCSGGIRALEHHSDSPESYYCHTPGLKVVMPSTPYQAKGLLVSAIRDPDPVIFMEPKRVYRAIKEEVPEKEYTIPLGKANIVKEGSDVTVITWGAMLWNTQKALAQIADTYSIELIDLRTLSPLDAETIIKSVKKTGRCVIIQEAPRACSLSAEIVAQINEKAIFDLEAPVERVTGHDTVMPLYKNELNYIPSEERIIKAIEKVMEY